MRHVFGTMGTIASLSADRDVDVAEIERIFERFDLRFSLYREDSELSMIAGDRMRLEDATPELLAAYAEALEWRAVTGGAFSPHRPDGVIDLNGIVKASAMRDAARVLEETGATWSLVVGGDIVHSEPGERAAPVGIVDPADRSALLCAVQPPPGRRAIATSGSAERGDHIWLGGELLPAEFTQVTVMADDIVTADVLATTIVAAGPAGLDDVCDRWPVDVLTVDRRGSIRCTPGFSSALSRTRAVSDAS